jgi:hypothetical protein
VRDEQQNEQRFNHVAFRRERPWADCELCYWGEYGRDYKSAATFRLLTYAEFGANQPARASIRFAKFANQHWASAQRLKNGPG